MKKKTTLADLLEVITARAYWMQSMESWRRANRPEEFMNAQFNFLYWQDKFVELHGKHKKERWELLKLAHGWQV